MSFSVVHDLQMVRERHLLGRCLDRSWTRPVLIHDGPVIVTNGYYTQKGVSTKLGIFDFQLPFPNSCRIGHLKIAKSLHWLNQSQSNNRARLWVIKVAKNIERACSRAPLNFIAHARLGTIWTANELFIKTSVQTSVNLPWNSPALDCMVQSVPDYSIIPYKLYDIIMVSYNLCDLDSYVGSQPIRYRLYGIAYTKGI